MAWLTQEPSGIFQIGFTFAGQRIKRSLRTCDEGTAEAAMLRVEENIRLVMNGRLPVPADADVASFLLSDGKLTSPQISKQKQVKLQNLFEAYRDSMPKGALGAETLRIAAIHMGHFKRVIGVSRTLRSIKRDDLQEYVNERSRDTGKRGKPISAGTIKKELSTLRTIWRWARQSDYVQQDFPNVGLRYPMQRQKFPFQIWEQIEARCKRGLPKGETANDYWDCLYLRTNELDELLTEIKDYSAYGFLYPMAFMAAHTGARRSELCRSIRDDIDFEGNSILIREKKRQKGAETFRHVPLSPRLRQVLQDWLAIAPASLYTFPAEHYVERTRNSGRRENDDSVAPDEATDHLSKALKETRWKVIRGWHIFRHSFISNCASMSVDQRMIDAWVGHQTEEMRRRYRHLFPHKQTSELERVFA